MNKKIEFYKCKIEFHKCKIEFHKCKIEFHKCEIEFLTCKIEFHICRIEYLHFLWILKTLLSFIIKVIPRTARALLVVKNEFQKFKIDFQEIKIEFFTLHTTI